MKRDEILDKAKEIVMKDRNSSYGEPEDNFATIRHLWMAYIKAKNPHVLITELSTVDVAAMMILMKVSRLVTSPSQVDHWIDIAGYAACGGGVATLQHD